jgi:transposase InsO family protein
MTNDTEYEDLKSNILKNPKGYEGYRLFDGKVFKKINSREVSDPDFQWKEYVPMMDRKDKLFEFHSSPTAAHLGIMKTSHRLRQKYYWPGLHEDVKQFVRNCETCQQVKPPNFATAQPMVPHKIPHRKFQVISIDFATELVRSKLQNKCFFVAVDMLSKYPWGYAARKADTGTMIKFLEQKFLEFGVPETIISDNGSQFTSKEYQQFLKRWKITAQLNPVYHPESNPAERIVQQIKRSIRSFTDDNQQYWDVNMDKFLAAIRSSVHETTKLSPYFVLFSQDMCLSGEYPRFTEENKANVPDDKIIAKVRDNIRKSWSRLNRNVKSVVIKYQPGQCAWRRNFRLSSKAKRYSRKLAKKWIKCEVVQEESPGIYITRDLDGKVNRFHANDMKPSTTLETRSRRIRQNERDNKTVSPKDGK